MKILIHKYISIALLLFLFFSASSNFALAQVDEYLVDQLYWGGFEDEFVFETGLGSEDPRSIVISLITIALQFLGILSVLLILLSGVKWMTSGGSEEKTVDAKKTFANAIIGLIIILSAFSLANFILNSFLSSTGG